MRKTSHLPENPEICRPCPMQRGSGVFRSPLLTALGVTALASHSVLRYESDFHFKAEVNIFLDNYKIVKDNCKF